MRASLVDRPAIVCRQGTIVAALFVLLLPLTLPSPAHALPPTPHYAGWAVEAYPEMETTEMVALVQRLARGGANIVWIGHNNPGEVDAAKVEPGLSYAVYEAALDARDPRHSAARAMLAAQRRMLAACRQVGIKAVLPVGYQIQMGRRWNEAHPADLRRDAAGQPLDIYGGGVSASFYAPAYRRDIEAYYRWLDREIVRPYADVILMLNLADEPIGGDYSSPAEAEFRRRTGLGFDQIGTDPQRHRLLGAFQSGMVVDYARYSAGLWHDIHPGLPVTMSFDGAQARRTFSLPDVEALFRDTPSNFVVTFDAYPRDGLPHVALGDEDLTGLYLLARSLGLYSARYGKPVWLWAAANSWGLSQASPDPGTVSDALANGIALALLVRQGGGELQGIAYWNYNVKEQGLYNDSHRTVYQPDALFARVSALLPTLRQIMAAPPSRPDVLILAPAARSHEEIGARRAAVLLEVHPFPRLAILAAQGVNAAVVTSLAGWLPPAGSTSPASSPVVHALRASVAPRAIVVLSPAAGYLAGEDLAQLRAFLARGGRVVASQDVGRALDGVSAAVPQLAYGGLVERRGNLYVAAQGVAALFDTARHDRLAGLWREVLGLARVQPGYRIVTAEHFFAYNRGPQPAEVELALPHVFYGHHLDQAGDLVARLYGTHMAMALGRREYLFLKRDWGDWPVMV